MKRLIGSKPVKQGLLSTIIAIVNNFELTDFYYSVKN